jgi:hypothetical protein
MFIVGLVFGGENFCRNISAMLHVSLFAALDSINNGCNIKYVARNNQNFQALIS